MENLSKKVHTYHLLLQAYVEELAKIRNSGTGVELAYQAIIDTHSRHYLLIRMGWHNNKFHYLVLIHIDLTAEGKIWLQQNNTEILIAEELEQKGVQKLDIVIGYRPEYMRPYTGYAVA